MRRSTSRSVRYSRLRLSTVTFTVVGAASRSREGNRFENREGKGRNFDHRGIVRGNFFEHGRHFGFRRFWHDQWVFLTDWDDCTAWVWLHVAPGVWAWRPVDICIG